MTRGHRLIAVMLAVALGGLAAFATMSTPASASRILSDQAMDKIAGACSGCTCGGVGCPTATCKSGGQCTGNGTILCPDVDPNDACTGSGGSSACATLRFCKDGIDASYCPSSCPEVCQCGCGVNTCSCSGKVACNCGSPRCGCPHYCPQHESRKCGAVNAMCGTCPTSSCGCCCSCARNGDNTCAPDPFHVGACVSCHTCASPAQYCVCQ